MRLLPVRTATSCASLATAAVQTKSEGALYQVSRGRPGRFGGAGPDAARGLSLAFEFAGAVFLFWFLGRLTDNWLGIEPWGQVIGAVIGWIGGFLHVYYATQKRS